jgi:hypothetical protein
VVLCSVHCCNEPTAKLDYPLVLPNTLSSQAKCSGRSAIPDSVSAFCRHLSWPQKSMANNGLSPVVHEVCTPLRNQRGFSCTRSVLRIRGNHWWLEQRPALDTSHLFQSRCEEVWTDPHGWHPRAGLNLIHVGSFVRVRVPPRRNTYIVGTLNTSSVRYQDTGANHGACYITFFVSIYPPTKWNLQGPHS